MQLFIPGSAGCIWSGESDFPRMASPDPPSANLAPESERNVFINHLPQALGNAIQTIA